MCDQSYSGTTTISRITEISSNGVTDIHEPLVFAAPGAVNAYGIQIILGTPSTTTSSSTTTTTAANPGGPSQTTIAVSKARVRSLAARDVRMHRKPT